ncbi:hypothetical protein HHI36_015504 [Cryptolaemus montrouzieri]|uniref:Gag-like protein n=1 Tax=Cryptolaemus montrouzieri TaxID=559131 RepID=A0ABD2N697_9CUCU
MTYFARSFNEDENSISNTSKGARWYNPDDDEELEEELKEVLKQDEDIISRVVMSSSTSESEGENDIGDGSENNEFSDLPAPESLTEEERGKKRPGKVFLMGASRNDYRTTTNVDSKSSSDESERSKKFYLYVTSFETKNQPKTEITLDKFKAAIASICRPFRILQVRCGILVTLNKSSDVDKILQTNFPKIFGGPVQIANISRNEPAYKKRVLFRTIPWVITLKEVRNCLERQGIRYGKIRRVRNVVKVEVLNANHEERLLKEGLNFYNTISFLATPDIPHYNDRCRSKEIIQCYKCQGFWHTATKCKNEVRCVRCGDHHEVEKCKKPKNTPLCCNCHGTHHAAYKLCPTRLKMMSYINLSYRTVPRKPDFLLRASTS